MIPNKNLEAFIKKVSSNPKNEYNNNSFVLELGNTELEDNVQRIESLKEGDSLKLVLVRVGGRMTCRICNKRNKEIGILTSYSETLIQLINDNVIEITDIVANSVVPVSKRKKGSKKALVSVRITFKVVGEDTLTQVQETSEHSQVADAVKSVSESTEEDFVSENVQDEVTSQEAIVEAESVETTEVNVEVESVETAEVNVEAESVETTEVNVEVESVETAEISVESENAQDFDTVSESEKETVVEESTVHNEIAKPKMVIHEYTFHEVERDNAAQMVRASQMPERPDMFSDSEIGDNGNLFNRNEMVVQPNMFSDSEIPSGGLFGMSEMIIQPDMFSDSEIQSGINPVVKQASDVQPVFDKIELPSIEKLISEPQVEEIVEEQEITVLEESSDLEAIVTVEESSVEEITEEKEMVSVEEPISNEYVTLSLNEVKSEIEDIINKVEKEVLDYMEQEKVDCASFNRALTKILNVMMLNKIDDENVLISVLNDMMGLIEAMISCIIRNNKKMLGQVDYLKRIESGQVNPKFSETLSATVTLSDVNDSNILKLSEGIEKIWNTIPKKDSMENLIERCMTVATSLINISKQEVKLLDINGFEHGKLKYVSYGMIEGSYDKWQSAYEYLPFVKEKKHKFYLEELNEMLEGYERTKVYYEKMKKEKEDLLNTIREERVECEEQLASLGIFAFGSKKYCRERIVELEKEEEHAAQELEGIINDYSTVAEELKLKIENMKTKVAWYSIG